MKLKQKLLHPEFQQQLRVLAAKVPGTAQYWLNHRSELEWQVCEQGIPALFITLSSNDLHWGDLKELYGKSRTADMRESVKNDPFTAVTYFLVKWREFKTTFLYRELGVVSHFAKFEFQGRGSIHVHLLAWHPCT